VRAYAPVSSKAQAASSLRLAKPARPQQTPEPHWELSPRGTGSAAFDFGGIPPLPPRPPLRIQAKLAVGASDDEFEQEADRIADQVMSAPVPSPRTGSRGALPETAAPAVAQVRTKSVPPNDSGGTEAPSIVHEVLNSPGQPLDRATRAFMEPRFGHDFSRVRVHADANAARSTQALGALAYTAGHQIVFGQRRYRPHSDVGKALLAHELAHTIQQGRGALTIRRKEDAESKEPDKDGKGEENKNAEKKGEGGSHKLPISITLGKFNTSAGEFTGNLGIELEVETMSETEKPSEEEKKGFFKSEGAGTEKGLKSDDGRLATELSAHLSAFKGDFKAAGLTLTFGFEALGVAYWRAQHKEDESDKKNEKDKEKKKSFEYKILTLSASLAGEISKSNMTTLFAAAVLANIPGPPGSLRLLIAKGLKLKISLKGEFVLTTEFFEKWLKKKAVKAAEEKIKELAESEARKVEAEAAIKEADRAAASAAARKAALKEELKDIRREMADVAGRSHLAPQEAEQELEKLRQKLGTCEAEIENAGKAVKAERGALKAIKAAAKADRKAAKAALKSAVADAEAAEFRLSRYEKAVEKAKAVIAKPLAAMKKISGRMAGAVAGWIERRAATSAAVRLAKEGFEFAAKALRRALPFVGEVLMIWDAINMARDIGSVLWGLVTGKLKWGGGGGGGSSEGHEEDGEGAEQPADRNESADQADTASADHPAEKDGDGHAAHATLNSDKPSGAGDGKEHAPDTTPHNGKPPPTGDGKEHAPDTTPHNDKPPPTGDGKEHAPDATPHDDKPPPTGDGKEHAPDTTPHDDKPPPTGHGKEHAHDTTPHDDKPPPTDDGKEHPPDTTRHDDKPPPTDDGKEHPPDTTRHDDKPPPTGDGKEHPPDTTPHNGKPPPAGGDKKPRAAAPPKERKNQADEKNKPVAKSAQRTAPGNASKKTPWQTEWARFPHYSAQDLQMIGRPAGENVTVRYRVNFKGTSGGANYAGLSHAKDCFVLKGTSNGIMKFEVTRKCNLITSNNKDAFHFQPGMTVEIDTRPQ
jgi:hypothetical protein